MSDRPEHSKAGAVAVNVPETVITSLDSVFDFAGMPEPGSVVHRLSPRNVADIVGVPTPDEWVDSQLQNWDTSLGIEYPPSR